jgi:hypothetical protein
MSSVSFSEFTTNDALMRGDGFKADSMVIATFSASFNNRHSAEITSQRQHHFFKSLDHQLDILFIIGTFSAL